MLLLNNYMENKTKEMPVKSEAEIAVQRISRAVISSVCLVTFTLIVTFYGLLTESTDATSGIIVGITLLFYLGLTYLLVYTRSRVAAWILLSFFCLEIIISLVEGGGGLGLVTWILIAGFAVGVQGAHQYQKNKPTNPIEIDRWIPPTLGVLAGLTILVTIIFVGLIDNSRSENPTESRIQSSPQNTLSTPKNSSAKEIYEKFSPAVVTLYFEDSKSEVQGSGVIVHENGLVVTNQHVLEGITQSSRDYARDVYGSEHPISNILIVDSDYDLGLIEITGNSHPAIEVGNSDEVVTGDKVYSIGSPEGFESTISEGIVSSIRYVGGVKIFQITNPISHGSSGGALVNENGELIGITSSFWSEGQNINFAVPSNYINELAQRFVDQNQTSE